MRGHVRKRGNKWYVIIYDGKKYKWYSGFDSEEDAEKERTKLLRQLDTNMYANPGKLTLGEYLERWVKDYCETNLSHNTYHRYKGIVNNHLIPTLGNHPIIKLQPLHVQQYYTEALKSGKIPRKKKQEEIPGENSNGDKKEDKPEGLSPASVLYAHRVLHEALKHAVEWQIIYRNVCDVVKPPKVVRKEPYTLDKKGLNILLEAAKDTELYIPTTIAAYTGMRMGEVLGLEWNNIDLKAGIIYVRQSLYWNRDNKKHDIKRTKNQQGRQVIMIKKLTDILTEWKKQQKAYKKKAGDDSASANKVVKLDLKSQAKEDQAPQFVCTKFTGGVLPLNYCTKAFVSLARKCKFFDFSFHDLRHTQATIMLELGIMPQIVAERLGHDVSVTEKVYSHVTPSMQRDAVLKLEEYFS